MTSGIAAQIQQRPEILENFMKTARSSIEFVPESKYTKSFFLLPLYYVTQTSDIPPKSEYSKEYSTWNKDQWRKGVFEEQMQTSVEILKSSKNQTIVLFVQNENEAKSYSEYVTRMQQRTEFSFTQSNYLGGNVFIDDDGKPLNKDSDSFKTIARILNNKDTRVSIYMGNVGGGVNRDDGETKKYKKLYIDESPELKKFMDEGRLILKTGIPPADVERQSLNFETMSEMKKYMEEGRVVFKTGKYGDTDVWARDWLVPVGMQQHQHTNNKTEFGDHKAMEVIQGWPGSTSKGASWLMERNASLSPVDDIKTTFIPAVVDGGNMTKTTNEGESTFVVGANAIIETKRIYKEKYNYEISTDEINEIYKKAFGAKNVLILGELSDCSMQMQPAPLFHIDFAVFFPQDKTAVMIKPEPGYLSEKIKRREEWKERPIAGSPAYDQYEGELRQLKKMEQENRESVVALDLYKEQLTKAGFRIIEIPTTQERVSGTRSYCNSNYFNTDKGTVIIMPSFDDFDGIENKIKAILENNGMKVIFIKDKAFEQSGNVHCVTGSLAYNNLFKKEQNTSA